MNHARVTVRKIPVELTYSIRQQILRPHQTLSEMQYPGDDHPKSLHAGGYDGDRLVGVASMYPQKQDETFGKGIWRIRGMAVLKEWQGKGVGKQLLELCLVYASSFGPAMVWCNAREHALNFYLKNRFKREGDPFDLPGIGVHYFVQRSVG